MALLTSLQFRVALQNGGLVADIASVESAGLLSHVSPDFDADRDARTALLVELLTNRPGGVILNAHESDSSEKQFSGTNPMRDKTRLGKRVFLFALLCGGLPTLYGG